MKFQTLFLHAESKPKVDRKQTKSEQRVEKLWPGFFCPRFVFFMATFSSPSACFLILYDFDLFVIEI